MTRQAKPLVVVIDADRSVRRALERLLRSSAFDVETYSSAGSYFESNRAERCDCLIVDETLDDCTGVELIGRIVSTASRVPPFIFTTWSDDEDLLRRIVSFGALACLPKPYESDAVLDALNLAVGRDNRPT